MKNIAIFAVFLVLLTIGWLALSRDGLPAPAGGAGDSVAPVEVAPQPGDPAPTPSREAVGGAGGAPAAEEVSDENPAAADAPPPPAAGRGTLEITVSFVGRIPAPGVQVVCGTGATWSETGREQTDAAGKVVFRDLPPGTVYAKALRGGEGPFRIRAGQITRGRLAILEGVGVTIQVVDGANAPVEGARAWLSERWRNNRGAVVGRTDREGRLQLTHVSPHCQIAVRADGYGPSRLYPVRGAPGGTVQVRVVLSPGGGKVRGRVVDPEGQPVADALVLIGKEDPDYSHRAADGSWVPGAPPALRRTKADGRFAADGVPDGKLALQVRHPDFASWRGEIEALPEGGPVLEVVLQPSAVVRGQLTDAAAEPVGYGQVTVGPPDKFGSRRVQAGRDGRFEVRGLGTGEFKATARFRELRAEARLRCTSGAPTEWNPVLEDPAVTSADVLLGKVVDHANEPLAGWRVVARDGPTGQRTVSARTDAGGRFRLKFDAPSLRLWVHAPGRHSDFPALVRDDVRPAEGEVLLRVDRPERRAAEVLGTVVDAVGQPVQTQIQAWHQDLKIWRQFRTDARTGAFHIRNLPPGKLELKIVSENHPWRALPAQTLTAGQRLDLGQVALQNGGRIEGEIRIAGELAKGVKVHLFDARSGSEAGVAEVAGGRYRSGVLATGTYRVQVAGRGFVTAVHDVAVRAGRVVQKTFTLRRGAIRVLRFQIAEGLVRPRFLTVIVRKKRGGLAWNGGMSGAEAMQVEASLAPGEYRLFVYGPGSVRWLSTELSVPDLSAAAPLDFAIRPEK